MEQFHQSIQTWNIIQYVGSTIIGLTVGALFWLYCQTKINYNQTQIRLEENAEKKLEEKKTALQGKLKSKGELNEKENRQVNIWIGSNAFGAPLFSFKEGYQLNAIISEDLAITLKYNKNLKMSLSCKFRSIDNAIISEIQNNEWVINPNNFFQRNYDDHGLEVIGKDGIIKFRIDFTDPYNIKILGLITDGQGIFYISDKGMHRIPYARITMPEIARMSNEIPYMFVYPAETHFAERKK